MCCLDGDGRFRLDALFYRRGELAPGSTSRGIVAKRKASAYRLVAGHSPWTKVNPEYSQAEGRHDMFNAFKQQPRRSSR